MRTHSHFILIGSTCAAFVLSFAQPARGQETLGPLPNQPVSVAPQDSRDLLPRHAAIDSGAKRTRQPNPSSPMQMVWPLTLVLAALISFVFLMRRWTPGAKNPSLAGIQVVSRQFLSNKQSLLLVRFGRRMMLLGMTPDRIATLAQIDDPEEISSLAATLQRASPHSFSAAFARLAHRAASEPTEPNAEPQAAIPAAVDHARASDGLRQLLGKVRRFASSDATNVRAKSEVAT